MVWEFAHVPADPVAVAVEGFGHLAEVEGAGFDAVLVSVLG